MGDDVWYVWYVWFATSTEVWRSYNSLVKQTEILVRSFKMSWHSHTNIHSIFVKPDPVLYHSYSFQQCLTIVAPTIDVELILEKTASAD